MDYCIPDNIYPARGRKLTSETVVPSFRAAFPTIFTPQGDGNKNYFLSCSLDCMEYSRQYLPRKGTETMSPAISIAVSILIPDNIYPARGRKQANYNIDNFYWFDSRQYLPRKGTETGVVGVYDMKHDIWFPTIFTPQGDGNGVHPLRRTNDRRDSRQYLPRKGTETISLLESAKKPL